MQTPICTGPVIGHTEEEARRLRTAQPSFALPVAKGLERVPERLARRGARGLCRTPGCWNAAGARADLSAGRTDLPPIPHTFRNHRTYGHTRNRRAATQRVYADRPQDTAARREVSRAADGTGRHAEKDVSYHDRSSAM